MRLSIVSYLDPQASAQVRDLQYAISDITRSRASLLSWGPHVTLADGVEAEDDQIENLVESIAEAATRHPYFNLTASSYGFFYNRPLGKDEISTPYALFLKVSTNERLLSLSAEITKVISTYPIWYNMPLPYQPHITLAFRDLDRQGFDKGIAYLDDQQISLTATIDHIALVVVRVYP